MAPTRLLIAWSTARTASCATPVAKAGNRATTPAKSDARAGERVDDRVRHRTAEGMTVNDLRTAATELLPLDADRREMALVYLAFLAQAAVVPALAAAAEGAAQRLQEPLAARIAHAVQAGELPAHLDAEHEAARLRVLLDGLRLQLITTPRQTSARWALAVLDDHLAALAASAGAARDTGVTAKSR